MKVFGKLFLESSRVWVFEKYHFIVNPETAPTNTPGPSYTHQVQLAAPGPVRRRTEPVCVQGGPRLKMVA